MKLEVVFLRWVDTITDPETHWKNEELTDEFFENKQNIVEQVAFVWGEDNEYLHLVDAWMPGDYPLTSHRWKIPKAWIVERISLLWREDNIEE